MPWLRSLIDVSGMLPVDILQAMFAGIDPCATTRKFRQFSSMASNSAAARAFVQLEDWLNDGVPLSRRVAIECLQDWYIDNVTANGLWQTSDIIIEPHKIGLPTRVIVPEKDIIVPPETAKPLGDLMPNADIIELGAGHIGMIVGSGAQRHLYDPLADWLLNKG